VTRQLVCTAVVGASLAIRCGDSPVGPDNKVSAGTISKSPDIVGVVYMTTFTFQASGFRNDDSSPLTYDWEFGDETPFFDPTRISGAAATVMQTYQRTGVFVVKVTAKNRRGDTASATLRGVEVVSLTGIWGVRDAAGNFVVRNTYLEYNKEGITGNDTSLNCRFEVVGSVEPPRTVRLTWTRPVSDPGRDCQGRGLPVSALPVTFSFSGTINNAADTLVGTLNDGRAVTIGRCQRLSCF
jgi:hypothetical protein